MRAEDQKQEYQLEGPNESIADLIFHENLWSNEDHRSIKKYAMVYFVLRRPIHELEAPHNLQALISYLLYQVYTAIPASKLSVHGCT